MATILVINGKETEKLRLLTLPRIGENVKINNKETHVVTKIVHDVDLKNPMVVADIRIYLTPIKNTDEEDKKKKSKGAVK